MINVSKLSKEWLRGFTDAEGCFNVHITRNSTTKLGYQIKLRFILSQKSIDSPLLQDIGKFWGGGCLYTDHKKNSQIVFSQQAIIFNNIIPFFKENPLLTNKQKDFQYWVQCAEILQNKEHLTSEGFNQINTIKNIMNLKSNNSLLPSNPLINYSDGWVLGFLEGEGCFYLDINEKDGFKVQPRLEVGLHPIDRHILTGLNNYFESVGNFNESSFYPHWYIRGINKCYDYVLPFFDVNPPISEKKSKEYIIWKEAVLLTKNKEHLNSKGAMRIREIKKELSRNLKQK